MSGGQNDGAFPDPQITGQFSLDAKLRNHRGALG